VISVNLHRRHLNTKQKRDLIAELLKAKALKEVVGKAPRKWRWQQD
jgi:hypothetical protein